MANQFNSKVIFGGKVLIDLTGDTVSDMSVLSGKTFHDKTGATKTGVCTFDSDTSGDTAADAEILSGKTAHARGVLLTGTMPNNGSVKASITDKSTPVTIAQGYHDGSGTISLSPEDAAKLIPTNIRQGVTILKVTGSMTGSETVKLTTGSATPKKESQTILPPEGFSGFTQVTVAGIPYVESDNSAGGKTVTIG